MPKVYITKQQQMNNKLVSLIYGTMRVQNIAQRQMATRLGISQQAFSRKLKNAQFTFSDLVIIFEELGTPDEEIVRVMKG